MKINTARFGELEVDEKEIIHFEEGLFGFENLKRYIIFQMEEDNPLMWMQAIDDGDLAFILIRPFEFRPKYSLKLSDKDVEDIKLSSPDDSDIFAIVVLPEDSSKMTANLQGPLVINRIDKLGKQVISTNPRHKLKHYILQEMQENLG
jgi:flagellar assembly factor FliW